MAEKRSTYVFEKEFDYEQAKEHIHNKMYEDYHDSDKIYFEGYYYGEYFIHIMEDCSDPERAASLCREHHGAFRLP